jgi:hypothetical protein
MDFWQSIVYCMDFWQFIVYVWIFVNLENNVWNVVVNLMHKKHLQNYTVLFSTSSHRMKSLI